MPAAGDAPSAIPPEPPGATGAHLPPAAPGAGPVRRALLRGAVCALVLALGFGAVGLLLGEGRLALLAPFGACVGLLAVPLAWLEAWAQADAVGWRRAGTLALGALAGGAGVFFAFVQAGYTEAILSGGGLTAAQAELTRVLERLVSRPGSALTVFGPIALPFGVVTALRAGGLRLRVVWPGALLAWAVSSLPLALLSRGGGDRSAAIALSLVVALGLPPLWRLADAAEARVWPPG